MFFLGLGPLLGDWSHGKVFQDYDQSVQASVNLLGLGRFVSRLQWL